MAPSAPEPTADWAVRYSEHVRESTARAARTAELNTRLLKRIANGELSPVTLDRQYTAFLAAHAAAYTDDVAETSMRFLAGLIRAGTSYSHELVERIAPGEFETERREPPRFDPGDWGTGFQRLTDYAMAENTAVAALLRGLMEKVASGALSPEGMHAVSEEYHGEQVPQTVEELVTLFFDLLTRLDQTHAEFGNRYLEAVLDLAGDSEPADAPVELVAEIGRTASARLAVANNEAEPTTLRAVLTDVRRADGVGPAFVPEARVRPARFTLAAGAEEVVTLTVRLAAETFEPGLEYVGALHVLSPGQTVLAVPLRLRAAVPVRPGEADQADETDEADRS